MKAAATLQFPPQKLECKEWMLHVVLWRAPKINQRGREIPRTFAPTRAHAHTNPGLGLLGALQQQKKEKSSAAKKSISSMEYTRSCARALSPSLSHMRTRTRSHTHAHAHIHPHTGLGSGQEDAEASTISTIVEDGVLHDWAREHGVGIREVIRIITALSRAGRNICAA